MKKIILVILFLLLQTAVLRSQSTFSRTITKNSFEVAKSVVQTSDGGYAFLADLGKETRIGKWLVKTNASGDTLWTRTFLEIHYGFFYDRALVQTADSGFSFLVQRNGATRLLHISQSGDSLWEKTIDPVTGVILAQASGNGYIVAGSKKSGAYGNMAVCRLDFLGNELWTKVFIPVESGSASDPDVFAVREVPGGGFILAGGIQTGYFTYWPFLFRIGEMGDSLWFKDFRFYGDAMFISIDVIGDEGFYAGGKECIGSCNTLIMKLDPQGDTVWTRQQYIAGNQGIFSLRATVGGDVIVCGENSSSPWSYDTLRLLLRRYGKNGDILWDKQIGEYLKTHGFSLDYSADSGLIICGGVQISTDSDYHALLVRTDKDGNLFGTGLPEVSKPQLPLWPNPTTGRCTVTIPEEFLHEKQLTLQVFDFQGKLIEKTVLALADGKIRLHLKARAKGMYQVVLDNGRKSYMGKVVFE